MNKKVNSKESLFSKDDFTQQLPNNYIYSNMWS